MNYDRLKNDILRGTINRKNGSFRGSAIYRIYPRMDESSFSRIFEIVRMEEFDRRDVSLTKWRRDGESWKREENRSHGKRKEGGQSR